MKDHISGKFMEVSFKWNDQTYNLVNIYGPTVPGHTNSYFCREHFYTFVDSKVSYFDNMIIMGDYNNVVDPNIDIIRTYPTLNSDIEDVTAFTDILANRNLVDTYLSLRDEFSGPMMMTNKSSSNLDHVYNGHPVLEFLTGMKKTKNA